MVSRETPDGGPEIIGLVRRAVEGDVKAYGTLYSYYVDRIYRYVYYQVGNKTMAEDITEEVFVKGLKSIRTCRGKEKTFSAWLYKIASNHVIDMRRRHHKHISFDKCEDITFVTEINPMQEAEDSFERQRVMEAVSSLPKAQRNIILLKFFDEVENVEISRITGKREGAIRALQMRALSNLRKKLKGRVERDEK
ncbi:RNA polymerase sigma factor [Chloroflexota bacterium]